MSIAALRDAFNAVAVPQGVRCTFARLSYCDAAGAAAGPRDHQRLTFICVKAAGNRSLEVTSDPLPPGSNITAAAVALANEAIMRLLRYDR